MNFLTIIIPCFNESESIPELIKELNKLNKNINFLIVENGSNDNSKENLKSIENKLSQNIKVLYLNKNNGYGNGVFQGLLLSKNTKYLGWIHGDLQFQYSKLDEIFNKLISLDNQNTHVFIKGIRKGRSTSENLFSYFMGKIASLILKIRMTEINAQPTIFSNILMDKLTNPPKGFELDTYIYFQALKNNYEIVREEVIFPKRQFGFSNWNTGFSSRIRFSITLIKYFIELKKETNF